MIKNKDNFRLSEYGDGQCLGYDDGSGFGSGYRYSSGEYNNTGYGSWLSEGSGEFDVSGEGNGDQE